MAIAGRVSATSSGGDYWQLRSLILWLISARSRLLAGLLVKGYGYRTSLVACWRHHCRLAVAARRIFFSWAVSSEIVNAVSGGDSLACDRPSDGA